MKNILITGGAGFIGSNLALALIEKGYKISVLDTLSKQIHGDDPETTSPLFQSIKGKVKFIHGSVTDRELFATSLTGIDIVVHLAAETGTGQSMYEIEKYVQVNIGGTAVLLDLLANNKSYKVQKVIIASSRAIYGEGKYLSKELGIVYPKHRHSGTMETGDFEVEYPGALTPLTLLATDEESKIHPSSLYGITKQNQEQMVMTICPTLGIAPVAFRYQNVYGPGQSLSNPYTGILSIFSTLIKNNKSLNIFEDGKESRDFVYIDDVVKATILGLERDEANGEVFNVGTGKGTDVITVAESLKRNYGSNVSTTISGNYRLGDIRHNFADISKISSILGFQPDYSFEEGIRIFTDWVTTQEVQESKFDNSISEMREKGLLK